MEWIYQEVWKVIDSPRSFELKAFVEALNINHRTGRIDNYYCDFCNKDFRECNKEGEIHLVRVIVNTPVRKYQANKRCCDNCIKEINYSLKKD